MMLYGSAAERDRYVRFESEADIDECLGHVRFTPKSGHGDLAAQCLLCAKSGHMHHGKNAAPRLRWYGFDDAHCRIGRHNLREPEPSLLKQFAVLRFGPFLTAGDYKHGYVSHLAGVR